MVRSTLTLYFIPFIDSISRSKARSSLVCPGQLLVRSSRILPRHHRSFSRRIPLDREARLHDTPKPSLANNIATLKSNSSGCAPVTIEDLYEQLLSEASQGHLDRAYDIVTHLVKERHEEPNLRQYDGLILANIDPRKGSAGQAAALWSELKDEGLCAESGTYHKFLKVRRASSVFLIPAFKDGFIGSCCTSKLSSSKSNS